MHALIEQLNTIVGPSHVLTEGDLSAYEQDWRRRVQGKALAVVRPANTEEVAQVVKACAAANVSLVPQGGNTGMVQGSVPDDSGQQVVLCLTRMNAIRQLDAANLTLTVEAGAILQTVQQKAAEAGFLYPLSLAAEGSCTIGGNLATNAGGTGVLRYGNTRDLCLGLEVVTAEGEVWHGLSGLRKDNTGYDLRDLFIGSEGTLGVITAATLKLFPQPAAKLTAFAAVPSLEAAVALLGLAQRELSAGLTGFEVMNQFSLQLTDQHFPNLRIPFAKEHAWCVLLENSDNESQAHAHSRFDHLMERALEEGLVLDAVIAESVAQSKNLWHIRESIPLAQAQEGLNVKHDISLPVSSIPRFVEATNALLAQAAPGIRMVTFGHLGDGNLHYNVQAPVGSDGPAFLLNEEARLNTIVYEQLMQHGGSISAEHGIGSLKVDSLPKYKSPVALQLMRQIKHALDPKGIMNPGRVLARQAD